MDSPRKDDIDKILTGFLRLQTIRPTEQSGLQPAFIPGDNAEIGPLREVPPDMLAAIEVIASIDNKPHAPSNLTGLNWSRLNLYGVNLSKVNLANTDLAGADLTNADLSSANLTGANLTGANLTGANLIQSKLRDANLSYADVTGSKRDGADEEGVIWTGTKGR